MSLDFPTSLLDGPLASLDELGVDELRERKAALDRLLDDEGVHYRIAGRPVPTRWPLDVVPSLIAGDRWSEIERGVIQRAVLARMIHQDLYGDRELLARGLLPPEVVFGHPGFLRCCVGLDGARGAATVLHATDIAFTADGAALVLGDRVQAPSGAGYALANRVMLSRVLPSLYRDAQVHRVAPYFRSLRSALERLAERADVDEPRIVVLTPGSRAETSFEHAYVASYLGYPLVEGGDLTVRAGRVFLRSLGALEPVDVILRRVDADWCDPLELRSDSHLGVPGLIEAQRRGNVAIVNPLGAGVLESPALDAFLHGLANHLLGQDLILPPVPTWWCGDATARSHVLANLSSMVLKRVDDVGDGGALFGARLSAASAAELAVRIESEPVAWVGQDYVEASTVPTFDGSGFGTRRATLRTFAVARGDSFTVMPGGLTRVATGPDMLRISNQVGATSMDTWVLASEPEPGREFWLRTGPAATALDPTSLSPRVAENMFWMGRYAERAEAVTRLLRVVHDRRADVGSGAGPQVVACVDRLLHAVGVMTTADRGFVGPGSDARRSEPESELLSLAVDADRAGTLAFAVRRMIAAAETVREQLSVDTWLVLGALEAELQVLATQRPGRPSIVQERLGMVLEALLAMHGLAAESMVRDAAWHFLDIGHRLERAAQLASLLRSTVTSVGDTPTDSLLFESVLTAGESIVTYRRRYRSRAQAETLLDLLVADPGNPRSLRYQVDRLVVGIDALPGNRAPGRPTRPQRLALELSTALTVIDTERLAGHDDAGRRTALDSFLADTGSRLAALADAVRDQSFGPLLRQRPLTTTAAWLTESGEGRGGGE